MAKAILIENVPTPMSRLDLRRELSGVVESIFYDRRDRCSRSYDGSNCVRMYEIEKGGAVMIYTSESNSIRMGDIQFFPEELPEEPDDPDTIVSAIVRLVGFPEESHAYNILKRKFEEVQRKYTPINQP